MSARSAAGGPLRRGTAQRMADLTVRIRRPWASQSRPMRSVALTIWVAFIVFPVANAITSDQPSTAAHLAVIAVAIAFVGVYAGVLATMFRDDRLWARMALSAVIAAIAAGLTLIDQASWAFLFSYASACAGCGFPSRLRFHAVLGCTALAAGCTLLAGGSSGLALGDGAATVGVGYMMVLLADLAERNDELREARAQLAQAAVARERERFARDLHDLLGHSLSVIAIKAELAGRMLREDPDRAGAEVADVERVARLALREVRDAVGGYRRPTLDGELDRALLALAAAGIQAEVERDHEPLDPDVEAVLAWSVREGATNVIRHSGARSCYLRITTGSDTATVEVLDDGAGAEREPALDAPPGHGLSGLAERAERLRGTIRSGRREDGPGFRLAVSVPVAAGRP
ncbi:MAG TPA: sensor histidine kinase [Solirubrobacteraceae bacterium]|nr:sensor histidine kinase [Solirubrobacteraceae bacterium]